MRSIDVSDHACGVSTAAEVWCWGDNERGQLGTGDMASRGVPERASVPERVTQVSVGFTHTCAVGASGGVYCWGDNGLGNIGIPGSIGDYIRPVRVPNLENIIQVVAGGYCTCALDADGRVFCWGDNEFGCVGDPHYDLVDHPVEIALP